MVHTHETRIILLRRSSCAHGIGLARAGLTIRQDGHIVALDEVVDALAEVIPDALLIYVLAKDAVEDEQLLALRGLDGQVGLAGDLDGRPAESLGDQLESRVSRTEGRADPYGC